MRPKIVVTRKMDFYPDQIEKLNSLGNVKFYDDLEKDAEDWLKRCKGADVICSGKFGLKTKIYELSNVFISLPFVGVGWIDKNKIKERNITIAYSPGCNKVAVSEWIIGMIFNLLREFPKIIRNEKLPQKEYMKRTKSLAGKKICVLGKGNIGSRVGKICQALEMEVSYFLRDGDLIESIKNADVVINCLSTNPTTKGLLNKKFFESLKKGSYFITVTGPSICDADAMLEALDKGTLAGAAHDSGGIQVGKTNDPFYQKLINNPKVLVTPHISYRTDLTARTQYDMMIDNIESFLKGNPKNFI